MRPGARLLGALLAAPIGAIADCSHNNCLRAVIGEAFPTRDGAADCSTYLRVTVTPPISTFTATLTVPTLAVEFSTVVDESTEVDTVVASTETDYFEETATVEQTTTTTVVSTTTQTVDANGKILARGDLERRVGIPVDPTFPAYASACTSFAKYSSACSCMGFFPDTITVAAPSTTITVVSTSTSTSTEVTTTSQTTTSSLFITETTLVTSTVTISTTDATTTTSSTATAVATNIIVNGRFESKLSPWIISSDSQVLASIVGSGSGSVLRTGNLYNNNLFELYQTINGVRGTTYTCQYDWLFTNYYETLYRDGNTYVPYVHVYIGNDIVSLSSPEPPKLPGQWYTSTFTFTSSGRDKFYFDCASPQPRTGAGGGSNYLSLDNVSCFAS